MSAPQLSFIALAGIPVIEPGCDLAAVIDDAIRGQGFEPADGDIFVLAQKIVSRAENRFVALDSVRPSARAAKLAAQTDKDPRVVELILAESRRVVRQRPGAIIVEHRLGIVLANAGIDRSNVRGDEETVLLLPEAPDRSAEVLRATLGDRLGIRCGVLIIDSIGRPWRLGTTGVAIGAAGVPALNDLRGTPDLFGRRMEVSETAIADSLAAGAALLMGEGDEGLPVIVARGIAATATVQNAATLLRAPEEDLFRD